MDKFVISGNQKLEGSVSVSGAKNSALKIMAATLLLKEPVQISNVPNLMDIRTMVKVLEVLGAKVNFDKQAQSMSIDCSQVNDFRAPYELVKTMRASFQVMGPLLARFGEAHISQPGGCSIGPRPVDFHLKAFEEMGAVIRREHGYIVARAEKLKSSHIILEFPSVGATENVMMASCLMEGETILDNAAREPEVMDLANFLNQCGAKIEGAGTDQIRIHGVKSLKANPYRVMADRIEAGTLILSSCITRSPIEVKGAPVDSLELFLEKLKECGNHFEIGPDSIRVYPTKNPVGIKFTALPFPGFATDLQAPMMAYLCTAQGTSVIKEGVYENRFLHISELNRMGASIQLEGNTAIVEGLGVKELSGAPVMASDLRAGAALVLAGLAAQGETEVLRVYHIDRGYQKFEEKLTNLGAKITRAKA